MILEASREPPFGISHHHQKVEIFIVFKSYHGYSKDVKFQITTVSNHNEFDSVNVFFSRTTGSVRPRPILDRFWYLFGSNFQNSCQDVSGSIRNQIFCIFMMLEASRELPFTIWCEALSFKSPSGGPFGRFWGSSCEAFFSYSTRCFHHPKGLQKQKLQNIKGFKL